MIEVRRLAAQELGLSKPLLEPEGWSLEGPDLARLHRLGGAVGAFDAGRLVGFLTFVDTPPYRWVGNVAVPPAQRGKGIGRRIVGEAFRDATKAALYSVEKAVTLYERAGLVAHGEVTAMRSTQTAAPPEGVDLWAADDLAAAVALDAEVTGMDRSRLLAEMTAAFPAFVVRRGGRPVAFGIAKAYPDVTEIGPVVARAPADAWRLVDALMAVTHPPYDLVVPAVTTAATQRGFAAQFRAVPMFRGGPPGWDLARYPVAAGLEKG